MIASRLSETSLLVDDPPATETGSRFALARSGTALPLFRQAVLLALLTLLAIAVHGYHAGTDDAAIYAPAVKKIVDPALYPFGAEFFQTHARLSLFSNIVGDTARVTRLSADHAIFLWHVLCIFLLLFSAYRLLSLCFTGTAARWAGVVALTGLLTCPVAGTAVILMDPYLTARSLSTPVLLFALYAVLTKQYGRACLFLFAALLLHPQMALYGIAFSGIYLALPYCKRDHWSSFAAVFPFSLDLHPAQGVYRQVLQSRAYFLVFNWSWLEWLGVFGPLAVVWCMGRYLRRQVTAVFGRVCSALLIYGLLFTAAGVVLSSSPQFQSIARLQPMRAFHVVYIFFFLFAGAAAGEYLLQRVPWRWAALFAPLMFGMFTMDRLTYPATAHIEFSSTAAHNPWVSAFAWISSNTPKDAVFALDPDYLKIRGEDLHGFRAVAERSVVADNLKDSGAVSVFPALAGDWEKQVDSLRGWRHFQRPDFERLRHEFGVTWIVWQGAVPYGLTCPFSNAAVHVCQLPRAANLFAAVVRR